MPSDASLSRFGVLPDMIPRWYAPILNQPTSSPMMTRMFGGLCCCCAAAGTLAAVTATNDASRPRRNVLVILMARFLSSGCPNWAGSRRPVTVASNVRRDGKMQPLLRRETRKPRAMGGGFIHSVRAFRAEPTHVSCTQDGMVEQSQVREGLLEITLRYRSFLSDHAPHVREMRQSSCDAANAAARREC